MLCDIVTGQITGFGTYGYIMAVDAIVNALQPGDSR
jgi:3-dehydroquinate dehydratase